MRLFCDRRQPPSGGCFAREVCEPHVDSLSFVNMGLRKRQPPPEVNPRRKQERGMASAREPHRWRNASNPRWRRSEAWSRHENPIVSAMPRIRDGAGARHGAGTRTSGGGSIFNNPVLASIASLRGDKPGPYGNNPRRVVASTRRADVRRPKADECGCFADRGNRPPGVVVRGRDVNPM